MSKSKKIIPEHMSNI